MLTGRWKLCSTGGTWTVLKSAWKHLLQINLSWLDRVCRAATASTWWSSHWSQERTSSDTSSDVSQSNNDCHIWDKLQKKSLQLMSGGEESVILYVYRETNMESFEEFYMFNKSMNWILLSCCQSLKWCFITGTLSDTSQFLSVSPYKHSTCFCSESLNQDQNEIWSFLCWSLRVNVRRLTDSLKHLKAETLEKSSWASEVISLLKTLILTSSF